MLYNKIYGDVSHEAKGGVTFVPQQENKAGLILVEKGLVRSGFNQGENTSS
jgi:hypothetical protein